MLLLHGALPISPAPPSLPSASPLFWRQRISAMPTRLSTLLHSLSGLALLTATPSAAAPAPSASDADPISARTEGIGPYQRVVLRNVTIVNGTGAPAQGPYDIVLSGDRIAEIK